MTDEQLRIYKYKEMQERVHDAYQQIVIMRLTGAQLIPTDMDTSGSYPSELDERIAKLCGYKDADDMALNFRDETTETFKLLADPDKTYIIYKTLEARLK